MPTLKDKNKTGRPRVFIVTDLLAYILVGEEEDEHLITEEGKEDDWELKEK